MACQLRPHYLLRVVRKASSLALPNIHHSHTETLLVLNGPQLIVARGLYKPPNHAPLLFARSFSSSKTWNQNIWGINAQELASRKVRAGRRIYFIDLKQEAASYSKSKGQLFLKFSEHNIENKRRQTMLIDFDILNTFIQNLKEGFNKEYDPSSYSSLPSKMFEHKTYNFYLGENNYGRFVIVKESYSQGIRADSKGQILIAMEYLQFVINEFESILFEGKSDNFSSSKLKLALKLAPKISSSKLVMLLKDK